MIIGSTGLALVAIVGPFVVVDELMLRWYYANRPLLSAAAENSEEGRRRLRALLDGEGVEASLAEEDFSCSRPTQRELDCFWSEAEAAPGLYYIAPILLTLRVGFDEQGAISRIETQKVWAFL